MKFLLICIIFLSSFVVDIVANNDSVPFEVLYFYYIYKMQYINGGTMTIAPSCEPADGRGSCFFDDFVKYIMEESFVQQYRPGQADHTKTPTSDNLVRFKAAVTLKSVSYRMEKLLPELGFVTGTGNEKDAAKSQTALLNRMLHYANQVLDTGSALVDDATNARDAAQSAMFARAQALIFNKAVNKWLDQEFTKKEMAFLIKTYQVPDWDESLETIENSNELDADERNALKEKFKTVAGKFGNAVVGAPVSDQSHLSIMRSLQDGVREISSALNRVPDEEDTHVPPVAKPLSECSSDFSSESDSDASSYAKRRKPRNDRLDGYAVLGKKQEFTRGKLFGGRALTPISVSSSGAITSTSTSTTSSTSSPVPTNPSAAIATSSVSQSTSKSSESSRTSSTEYTMSVTTVFTPPPQCSGRVTEVATMTDVLWQDIIDPVPGVTMTSCYPDQFVASALATTSLPPFSKLVCPDTWESYNVNSTYVICCPNGFGLYAPNFTNTVRPGQNAICTSVLWPNALVDITSYNSTAMATVLPGTVGVNGTLVFATAFDGNTVTPASTPTSTSHTTTSETTTSNSSETTSSRSSTPSSPVTTTTPTSQTTQTSSSITASASLPAISSLPACGQTCMNNMLGQYAQLGCSSADPACLCRNVNFGYGVRDCSNGACGAAVASTVISFASSYCSIATVAETTFPATATATATATPTVTAIADLPACGQTCMNNMIGQYSALGCASPQPTCLCGNVNFGYGIRDCANGACGTAVATTVISFGSAYCASATASP